MTIVNNTMVLSSLTQGTGGGLWIDDLDATLTSVVANNILVANTALVGGAVDHSMYFSEILQNAFHQNQGGDLYNAGGSTANLVGNVNVDPQFSSPAAGNYRLAGASPLVDSADSSMAPVTARLNASSSIPPSRPNIAAARPNQRPGGSPPSR